jgi:hypothetical protein
MVLEVDGSSSSRSLFNHLCSQMYIKDLRHVITIKNNKKKLGVIL